MLCAESELHSEDSATDSVEGRSAQGLVSALLGIAEAAQGCLQVQHSVMMTPGGLHMVVQWLGGRCDSQVGVSLYLML